MANEAVGNLKTAMSPSSQGYFIGTYLDGMKNALADGWRTSCVSGMNFEFVKLILQTMWEIAFCFGAIFVRGIVV